MTNRAEILEFSHRSENFYLLRQGIKIWYLIHMLIRGMKIMTEKHKIRISRIMPARTKNAGIWGVNNRPSIKLG